MILNVIVTILFGYWLVTKDYTKSPKWVYYCDGFVFALNFAIVFKYLIDMTGF